MRSGATRVGAEVPRFRVRRKRGGMSAAGRRFRRWSAVLLAVLSIALMATSGCERRDEPLRPKAYVLVIVDTLRPDFLGAYGAPEHLTPNIDRIAGEGIQF